MTQPIFTTRECELLDEALGAFSDTYGEALSDDAATELEELGFKIWRLGPEKQRSPQTEVRVCPGWGEECGNKTEENADLCADCRMARLDTQSPRIPL
ncbi:hypothetical protein ACFWXE_28370 [[Kitasatospora] papulosa]|uniref:hypothetical protein n=1 Tax=[Kitasatospora] papulosa TaxID=1464011 RepID=UPI0005E67467